MLARVYDVIKEFISLKGFPYFRNSDQTHHIPPMDAGLLPNSALDSFLVVADSLVEMDDVTVGTDGYLYVSSENRILRFDPDDERNFSVFAELEAPLGGLSFHTNGELMVCVKGRGLVFIDAKGSVTRRMDTADGRQVRCALSAVCGPDGSVYVADGTIYHDPEDWYFDLMEKRKSGRLIRYNLQSSETEVLLSGLSYPYGVEISHDGKWLIMSESWSHTVSRYPLHSIQENTKEVVIPNLPGYPGRIRKSSDGGYWMCIFAMRTHLVEFVLGEDKYRREMMRSIDPAYWIRPALSSGEDFLEPLQAGHAITLGIMKPWAPPRSYGLVVKMDDEYEIIESYHCRTGGKRHGITGVTEKNGELFVISKGNSLVLRSGREVIS